MTGYTREQLTEMLKDGIYDVTFTKVNGEQRIMPCTLKEGIVPPKPPAEIACKSVVKRHTVQNVLSVWCTDSKGWRSFRIDSLIDIKKSLNE